MAGDECNKRVYREGSGKKEPYCRMADGVGIVVFPAALEEPEDTEADEERSYQNRISGNECHSSFS